VSEIIGMAGMSHSPFVTMLPPPGGDAPGSRFLADADRVAAAVAELAPDALVVIGPDHFHANFYDAMPPFVLGVEEAEAFGDFGSRSGPLPVASPLAWSIRDGLARDGFDIALSYSLTGRSAPRSGPPTPDACWSWPAEASHTGCRPTTRETRRSPKTAGLA
jgi:2,3-dihydroxyphenylpropionate 1,2-dioxygenase